MRRVFKKWNKFDMISFLELLVPTKLIKYDNLPKQLYLRINDYCSMELKHGSSEEISTSTNQNQQTTVDSPMQIRMINFLGLKNYLMEKLIFKRKPSTYKIRSQHGKVKLLQPLQYKPPVRYEMQVGILEYEKHSIPFVKLLPRNRKQEYFDTIVYAHGNSSDMADGLRFMERMALIYEAEYVIFDYNGYGQSRNSQVGEDIISRDIEIVLGWLNKPLNQIILWGFSLGTYPVLFAAAKYFVKGVILQCPIASVGCFFRQDFSVEVKFKQDYFCNVNLIGSVKGKIFMIHSHDDEVIPISHAKLLFDKYVSVRGFSRIFFIEVMKVAHNGVHKYIVSQKTNDLQKELLSFLQDLKANQILGYKDIDQDLANLKDQTKLACIQQNSFDEDNYQIVDGPQHNIAIKSKKPELNCFCFPNEASLQSSREKFRSD